MNGSSPSNMRPRGPSAPCGSPPAPPPPNSPPKSRSKACGAGRAAEWRGYGWAVGGRRPGEWDRGCTRRRVCGRWGMTELEAEPPRSTDRHQCNTHVAGGLPLGLHRGVQRGCDEAEVLLAQLYQTQGGVSSTVACNSWQRGAEQRLKSSCSQQQANSKCSFNRAGKHQNPVLPVPRAASVPCPAWP